MFIAGQYDSDAEGTVISPDFAEQVERSFGNLGTALEATGLNFGHVVRLGTYLAHHDQERLEALQRVISGIWRDKPPAQTLIGVAAPALPDMLFEPDRRRTDVTTL